MEAYSVPGFAYQLHEDWRIQKPEAWNLAFLSHDFERERLHPDPHFLTHVTLTCKRLESLSGRSHPLLWPAAQFVRWLCSGPVVMSLLQDLNMFNAYGMGWLATVQERSWLCCDYDHEPEALITDTSQAMQLLQGLSHR